jgi:DNA-binding NarL/FixJ family response regulator
MVRIFLADNHVLIRGGLRSLLRPQRDFCICGEADNGRDAIDLTIRAKPDVLVVNINLTGINGIEVTRQILRETPNTEVLIFTTSDNEDLMRQALQAGARGYLLKSCGDDQVIAAIRAVAGHRPYHSHVMSEKLLDSLTPTKRGGDNASLTAREQEILRLIAEGHRGKEVALMLGISVKTVDTHRTAGMRKLHLRSIAEVVRYAIRERLIRA